MDRKGVVKLDKKGKARPNPISTGLNEWQLEQLKDTVVKIRRLDGNYKFIAAKLFYDLRGLIRGTKKGENPKQWTAFKKSGLVPFSAREIQDLCGCYEWMKTSGLEPEMFNTVGIRTMYMIANCDNKAVQKKLEAALAGGEQVTRLRASLMINPPESKQPNRTLESELASVRMKMKKWDTGKTRTQYENLYSANYKLQEEIVELKKKLKG